MTFPTLKKPRNANYKLLSIFKSFEVVTDRDSLINTRGNINYYFQSKGLFGINEEHKNSQFDTLKNKGMFEVLSAPYLLAKLVSAGCIPFVEGQDGYKNTWTIALKHKKTGHIITFYDFKSASSVGSSLTGYDSKDEKTFLKDAEKLIQALINERFPHPYDGCVIGEVA